MKTLQEQRTESVLKMQEHITELEKENAKAKELLKEFVHHYKAKTIYIGNMKDLLEQAEQFLNENSTYERIQKAKYNYAD